MNSSPRPIDPAAAERPDVFAEGFVLPAGEGEAGRTERLGLLRGDQYRRHLEGDPVPVERYLNHFAGLLDADAIVDLICGEMLLRAHFGLRPDIEEYAARFPDHAEILRRQHHLMEALIGNTIPPGGARSINPAKEASLGPDTLVPSVADAATPPEAANAGIPGYSLLRVLGRGGMGVVYLAEQVNLRRLVALKRIRSETSDQGLTRFRAEAATLARLRHPGIVQIHDIGEVDGLPYFSMEYLEGGSLADHLQEPRPGRWAASLLADLAEAVEAAHRAGILHRDLKPANVLLERVPLPDEKGAEGLRAKITDFGLAKQLDQETRLTASGALLGTPAYMAPEQIEPRQATSGPTTDIYGLGAILYEMLTGRPPFRGGNFADLLAQVLHHDPPPPSRTNPRVHPDLETICLKCLHKEPARRYGTAGDLAGDLRRFLAGEPIRARPLGRLERCAIWCRRRPTQALGAAVLLLVGFLLVPWLLWNQGRLREAEEKRRTADALARSADNARLAAQENARTQEYFALVNDVRQSAERRPLGWTWRGLRKLRQAADLDTPVRDLPTLRSEAALCLGEIDLRSTATWATDLPEVMLAFSSDGRWLAVADYRASGLGQDFTVRILDGRDGKEERNFQISSGLVLKGIQPVPDGTRSLAFGPKVQRLFLGTRSGKVLTFSLREQEQVQLVSVFPGLPVDHLYPAADGKGMVVASRHSNLVTRWEPGAGSAAATFDASEKVSHLLLLPSGEFMCADRDGAAFLDRHSLQPKRRKNWHLGPAASSRSGEVLAGIGSIGLEITHLPSDTRTIRLDDPDLDPRNTSIQKVQMNPDESLILTVSYTDTDRHVRLWDLGGAGMVATLKLSGRGFADAAFHPTQDSLVLAEDGKVELFQIGGLRVQQRVAHSGLPGADFTFLKQKLVCLHLQKDLPGKYPAVRTVSFWKYPSGAFERTHPEFRHTAYPFFFGRLAGNDVSGSLAVLAHPFNIFVMDPEDDRSKFQVLGMPKEAIFDRDAQPSALAFDRRGKRIWVIRNRQRTLQSWRWPQLDEPKSWQDSVRVLQGTGELYCLAAGTGLVALGSRDGLVHLLDQDGFLHEGTWKVESSPVRSVALDEQEKCLAAGDQEGRVQLFEVPTGRILAEIDDHHDAVESIAFYPHAQLLATGSRDGTARLYRLTRSGCVALATLEPGPVRKLEFSPDGRNLAILVHRESTLRLWRLDLLRARLADLHLAGVDWQAIPLPK